LSIIDDVFQPILGKACWQVEQGYASFLTFEFGEPHLRIQEPRQASKQASEKLRKRWARRHVIVYGEWHLWVYICDWQIFLNDEEIANNTSSRKIIKNALLEIDGQLLTSVTIKKSHVSIFEFDLGGRLEIIPNHVDYEKTVDLWLLYEPSGNVFTLRADGKYRHRPGDGSVKDKWETLENSKSRTAVKKQKHTKFK
jgi:hypothetical protein